jgi:hypothetical protein
LRRPWARKRRGVSTLGSQENETRLETACLTKRARKIGAHRRGIIDTDAVIGIELVEATTDLTDGAGITVSVIAAYGVFCSAICVGLATLAIEFTGRALGFLGEHLDAAYASGAFFAIAFGIAGGEAAISALKLDTTVIAGFAAEVIFASFAFWTIAILGADLFGGAALVVAGGGSIGHLGAIAVGLAGFSGAGDEAIIARLTSAIDVILAALADGAIGFAAFDDLAGVIVVTGTEADGATIEVGIFTTAIFGTLVVFAEEATAGALGIGKAAIFGKLTTGGTKTRLDITVLFFGAFCAGLTLAIELTTSVFTGLLALALTACSAGGNTATTAAFTIGAALSIGFTACDTGSRGEIADLIARTIGIAGAFTGACAVSRSGLAKRDLCAGIIGVIESLSAFVTGSATTASAGASAVLFTIGGGETKVVFIATFAASDAGLAIGEAVFAGANALIAVFAVDIAVEIFIAERASGLGCTGLAAAIADLAFAAFVACVIARRSAFAAACIEVTNGRGGALTIDGACGDRAGLCGGAGATEAAIRVCGAGGRISPTSAAYTTLIFGAFEVIFAGDWGGAFCSAIARHFFGGAFGNAHLALADLIGAAIFVFFTSRRGGIRAGREHPHKSQQHRDNTHPKVHLILTKNIKTPISRRLSKQPDRAKRHKTIREVWHNPARQNKRHLCVLA